MEWILRYCFFQNLFLANIRYDTVYFTVLILFCTNIVLPISAAVCKGEKKTLLSNFTPARYLFQVFFLKQVVLIEREGEKKREAQQKYAHLSWASINSLPQNSSCEFGQLMGRHIFASATSAPGFSFLVRKKKNISKKVQAQGCAVPSCCRKIQQSLSACQGHQSLFSFKRRNLFPCSTWSCL